MARFAGQLIGRALETGTRRRVHRPWAHGFRRFPWGVHVDNSVHFAYLFGFEDCRMFLAR